ncbi:hypothetical protein DXG01_005163 [Tephrocybe rancida]|nr:hypothetical protein DXG01_005163 [Tephrocybe rancida]
MLTKARNTTINGGTFTQHMHFPASESSSEPAQFQLLQHSAPATSHFTPILALLLALSPLHESQPGLVKALQETPSVAHGALPTQVEQLLLQPLRGASVPGLFLVIVDALDQCEGEENQREVLAQLVRIVRAPRNPLRFIVTSANAPHLHHAFNEPEWKAVSSSTGVTNLMTPGEALGSCSVRNLTSQIAQPQCNQAPFFNF